MKRREFRFDQLQRREEDLLFAWAEENQAFVPTPIREWPLADFRELVSCKDAGVRGGRSGK